MVRTGRFVLTIGLALLLAGSAAAQQRQRQRGQGQQRGQGGVVALLENEGVQKELKLDKDQTDKVKEAVQKVRDKYKDQTDKLRDLSQEERRQKGQELTQTISQETLQSLNDVLKPDQLKRLKQIELQQVGAQAFARPDVQKALNLTADQQEKIKTISDDAAKEMRQLFQQNRGNQGGNQQGQPNRLASLRKETMDKVQAVLTDDQKKAWKDMTGDSFEVARGQRRRQGGER
jgi:hypothetical protein